MAMAPEFDASGVENPEIATAEGVDALRWLGDATGLIGDFAGLFEFLESPDPSVACERDRLCDELRPRQCQQEPAL